MCLTAQGSHWTCLRLLEKHGMRKLPYLGLLLGLLIAGILGLWRQGSDSSLSVETNSASDAKTNANQNQATEDAPKGKGPSAEPKILEFTALAAPDQPKQKASLLVTNSVKVNGKSYPIGFQAIAETRQKFKHLDGDSEVTFGALTNSQGVLFTQNQDPVVCSHASGPDHTSLLTFFEHHDQEEPVIFAITQLECSVGGAYITKLTQKDGHLKAEGSRPVDFSDVHGTYVNCAGQTTPWGTHLGSEEYEVPMVEFDSTQTTQSKTSLWGPDKLTQWFGENNSFNERIYAVLAYNNKKPTVQNAKKYGYHQGWTPEIRITSELGDHVATKHYAMGRFSHEIAYVMPDKRTVYMSDDGTNTGFFMFVADKPKTLSSGTLYAAKWTHTDAADSRQGAGKANIEWINLGSTSNHQIEKALYAGVTFEDLFEKQKPNADRCTSEDFKPVNSYSTGLVCVKLKQGEFAGVSISTLASRLETRLYAGYLGATTEFRKEEGISFNPDDNVLYVAMSELVNGMQNKTAAKGINNTTNKYDLGGYNHIQLESPNLCGAVYALDRASTPQKDNTGSVINSSYVVHNMYGIIEGEQIGAVGERTCVKDKIANPDNISYLPGYGVLIIGEDAAAITNHENNFVWAYNIHKKTLTRIASTPIGGEATSVFWQPNVNGYGYITLVNQHPNEQASQVGYIGPFPALD